MRKQAAIFVLIDALGWEWVKNGNFLQEVAPYRRRLKTVLGYSAGAIPSILTGRLPSEHGRFTMYQRAADGDSPFQSLRWICDLPPALVENRYVRRVVRSLISRVCGIGGYYQLYGIPLRYLGFLDVPEKNCVYRPGGIAGSTSIFDLLLARNITYRTYWYARGADDDLMSQVQDDLQREESGFYFLYLAGIDAFLHEHADDPALVSRFLARYEAGLCRINEIAQAHFENVALHVFSDHGMAPTLATVDLPAKLVGIDLDPTKSCLTLIDSTMARFWFYSDAVRTGIKAILRDDESGHWMSEGELKSLGAWFPDHRYGEEIYLLSEGLVFAPSHMGDRAPKGMHGFHPEAPHSYASFLSSHDYSDRLQSITDIFGLMEQHCQT